MTTIKVKVTRPKFYDHFGTQPVTDRVCPREGCENPAVHIDGFYLVDSRRVRVWVCVEHKVGSPNIQLPVPFDVQAALDADAAYYEENRRKDKFRVEGSVSVKAFGQGGHGDPIPHDRVKNWRWGGY